MTLMIITSVINTSEAQVKFTKKIGGENGTSFMLPSSRQAILSTDRITGIAIQHGRRIEQIELEYSIGEGFNLVEHIGNDAGEWSYINLEPGEFITYITGQAGTLIDQITFHTSLRRTFGPYGGSGGQYFELTVPSDAMIIGFTGKVGPSIKQIGLIYRRPDQAHDISRNKNRGTHYGGANDSEELHPESRTVRDHRTKDSDHSSHEENIAEHFEKNDEANKKSKNELLHWLEIEIQSTPPGVPIPYPNMNTNTIEDEPTSTSKRTNIQDHRTEDNQDTIGVVYASGIGALIQVTQLKSQFANEEAPHDADKQRNILDKKEEKPKQKDKK